MKYIFVLLLIAASLVYAQENKQKSKAEDALREMEEDKLTLHFINALTGSPIEGARIEIANIGTFQTDYKGRVFFEAPESDGTFPVKFSLEDYASATFDIEINLRTLFYNRFSVSPVLPVGSIRVVVDWSDTPRDLDAHFVKAGGYHISYRDMHSAEDGSARLDRDDTDGWGPETITANVIDPTKEYTFYVHDYSNRNNSSSDKLSKSKASVKVYGNQNELLHIYKVPENLSGTTWVLFKLVNGKLTTVNTIAN